MSTILERNNKIREAGIATRLKRSGQVCKTFKFKIPTNRISKSTYNKLKMVFVESKWIYNYLLSKKDEIDLFDIVGNYKNLDTVIHYDKDKNMVTSKVEHILSSVRQELMQQIANQIKGLSKLKEKGHNVGALKYKSDFHSVKYKQYGVTHRIQGNKIKIQGIKELIPILGIKQLKQLNNPDITTMNLIKEVDDFYVCLTVYYDNINNRVKGNVRYNNNIIGIDLGIANNLTLSNGDKINCYVEESERIKTIQRQIERTKKGSNNRYKLRKKLQLAYIKDSNKKNDIANKIVHQLLSDNRIIVIQDDNLNYMKDGKEGSITTDTIQHSILGRIKSRLKQSKQVIWLDRWCPTTQYCSHCGIKTKHTTDKREFVCKKCGHMDDRDIHAANNMVYFLLEYLKSNNIDTSQELAGVPPILKWKEISKVLPNGKEENTTSLALC